MSKVYWEGMMDLEEAKLALGGEHDLAADLAQAGRIQTWRVTLDGGNALIVESEERAREEVEMLRAECPDEPERVHAEPWRLLTREEFDALPEHTGW